MTKDLTILIQGPIKSNTFDNIDIYINYGEVIVSTWEESINFDITKYKSKVKFVINKLGINVDEEGNKLDRSFFENRRQRWRSVYLIQDGIKQLDFQNVGKQINSTLYGIYACNTKYILKIRSDETYTKLDPLLEFLDKINNEDQIITGNVFVCNDLAVKNYFSISDHLLCGRTTNIKNMFEFSKRRLINDKFKLTKDSRRDVDINNKEYFLCPETLLSTSYIIYKDKNVNIDNYSVTMKKYFKLFNVWKLGDVVITATNQKFTTYEDCRRIIPSPLEEGVWK